MKLAAKLGAIFEVLNLQAYKREEVMQACTKVEESYRSQRCVESLNSLHRSVEGKPKFQRRHRVLEMPEFRDIMSSGI